MCTQASFFSLPLVHCGGVCLRAGLSSPYCSQGAGRKNLSPDCGCRVDTERWAASDQLRWQQLMVTAVHTILSVFAAVVVFMMETVRCKLKLMIWVWSVSCFSLYSAQWSRKVQNTNNDSKYWIKTKYRQEAFTPHVGTLKKPRCTTYKPQSINWFQPTYK